MIDTVPSCACLPAARLLTRVAIAPLFSTRVPDRVRRRLLDVTGRTVPCPRGTRRSTTTVAGRPVERVAGSGAVGPHQLLYLHGGGYTAGSSRSHRALIAHLGRAVGAPVHVPDYRLAPEHPHPAAVDDALAAFRALRAAGHDAQRIAIVGDSAGAGLAVAVLLRLRGAGEDLPGSVGLISPWLDLDLRSPTVMANARTDVMLNAEWLAGAALAYRGDHGDAGDHAELRPLEADLTGLPPIHVVAGTGEILLGDADALVERLRSVGGHVTYRREPGMWHDYVVFAGLLALADDTVTDLGELLRADCTPAPDERAALSSNLVG